MPSWTERPPDRSCSQKVAHYPGRAVLPCTREGIAVRLRTKTDLHLRWTNLPRYQRIGPLRFQMAIPLRPKELQLTFPNTPESKIHTSGGFVETRYVEKRTRADCSLKLEGSLHCVLRSFIRAPFLPEAPCAFFKCYGEVRWGVGKGFGGANSLHRLFGQPGWTFWTLGN